MAADDGHRASTSELLFVVPANLSIFERKIVYQLKQLGFIPYDMPDHRAELHIDVAKSSSLLVAEAITCLTNTNCFCWSDLHLKNNSELLNNLGNFINRALTFLSNNFGGIVPELQLLEEDKVVIAKVAALVDHYVSLMDKVRLRDSIRCILSVSKVGNQYIQFNKPWELVKGTPEQKLRSATVIGLSANIACLLSGLLQPFMPETSEALRHQLNVPLFQLEPHFAPLLKAGHQINKPVPLFKKIEQSTLDTLKKRFEGKSPTPKKKVVNGTQNGEVNHKNANKASGDISKTPEELARCVQNQGNKVRELKAAKADKATVEKEVACLLELKKQLALTLGQQPEEPKRQPQKKKK